MSHSLLGLMFLVFHPELVPHSLPSKHASPTFNFHSQAVESIAKSLVTFFAKLLSPPSQRHSALIFHLHSKPSHSQSSPPNCSSSVITSHSASSRQACERFAKPWSRFSQIIFTAFATSFRPDISSHSKHSHHQSSPLNCPSSVITSHSASSRQACERFAKPWSRFSQILFTAFAKSFRPDIPSFETFPLPSLLNCPSSVTVSHSASSRQACERFAKPWSRFSQILFSPQLQRHSARYSISFDTFPLPIFTSQWPFFCDTSHSASSRQACERIAKPWSRFSQILFTAFATSFRPGISSSPSQPFLSTDFTPQSPFSCHNYISRFLLPNPESVLQKLWSPFARFSSPISKHYSAPIFSQQQ